MVTDWMRWVQWYIFLQFIDYIYLVTLQILLITEFDHYVFFSWFSFQYTIGYLHLCLLLYFGFIEISFDGFVREVFYSMHGNSLQFSDIKNLTCECFIRGSVKYHVNTGNSNHITYFKYIFYYLLFKWLGFQLHVSPYICFFVLVNIFWSHAVYIYMRCCIVTLDNFLQNVYLWGLSFVKCRFLIFLTVL